MCKFKQLLLGLALFSGLVFGSVSKAASSPYTYDKDIAPGTFSDPTGLAIDSSGNIYVADNYNDKVYKISSNGSVADLIDINNPYGLALDGSGNIYVMGDEGSLLYKYSPLGNMVAVWGSQGVGYESTFGGSESSVLINNNRVYVSDYYNELVYVFTLSGDFVSSFDSGGLGEYFEPGYGAVDKDNNLWIPDYDSYYIEKFSPNGDLLSYFEVDYNPWTLGIDSQGNIIVTDWGGSSLYAYDTQGNYLYSIAGGFSPEDSPLAFDSSGNLYFADTGNSRVQKWTYGALEEPSQNPTITSWKAYLYERPGTSCTQRLKLQIKGKHFEKDAQVTIGGKKAYDVEKKSSKELTARFCLPKLLSVKTDLKRSIKVTNPDSEEKTAKKKIDLSKVADTSNLNPNTPEGIRNIQTILYNLKYLPKESITGFYGPLTTQAVKNFQRDNNIEQTGWVGPITKTKLMEKGR